MIALSVSALAAEAGTANQLLDALQAEAGGSGGQPYAASAARGESFFKTRRSEWSCSSCHTADPRQSGSHAVTGKAIRPMAPAVNPERFADRAKTDKWFRRNCKDVLARVCTPAEQADVVAYLISLH